MTGADFEPGEVLRPTTLFRRTCQDRESSEQQDHSHHSRAEAHAGPKELNKVHSAIHVRHFLARGSRDESIVDLRTIRS